MLFGYYVFQMAQPHFTEIKVKYKNVIYGVPVNNGKLPSSMLDKYFPGAMALTYDENGERKFLRTIGNFIEINPSINKYTAHTVDGI